MQKIKHLTICCCLFVLVNSSMIAQKITRADYKIIPTVKSLLMDTSKVFTLKEGMTVAYDANNQKMKRIADFLCQWVEQQTGVKLNSTTCKKNAAIQLNIATPIGKKKSKVALTKQQEEAYSITINKKGEAEFAIKTQNEKTVAKKIDEAQVEEFKNTVQEQPKVLNAYEKMIGLINSYNFNEKITNLLIQYFETWMNRRGRFAEADALHGYIVRAKINDLVSFKMSDDDMITCIQNSIDREWFKFVDQRVSTQPNVGPKQKVNTSSHANFDKTTITSGTFTEDDIQKLKEKAKALNAEGKKGTY